MFDRKKYMKKYREEHKKEEKKYQKEYYQDHKEDLDKLSKIWRKNNFEKVKESKRKNQIKYRKKYPEKIKAHYYANNHKQRDTKCRDCGSTINLHFHHTNYRLNEGFTLCRKCHNSL